MNQSPRHATPARTALLRSVAGFGQLPAAVLQETTHLLEEQSFAVGTCLITEGDAGDGLYIIAEGQAEISILTADGRRAIGIIGPGECLGEIALLSPRNRRTATITAVSPLRALVLSAAHFRTLLERHPETCALFAQVANTLLIANFLKQLAPFAHLEGRLLRRLAERATLQQIAPGQVILSQDAPAEECFLLRQGEAHVVQHQADGTERVLATLAAGAVFGESALLPGTQRNATVRAQTACEVLVLHRDNLLAIMGSDFHFNEHVADLLRLRDRPSRIRGVQVTPQTLQTGDIQYVLHTTDPQRFFRLSPEGYFIWQLLDGEHTLKDIALAYFVQFKAFAPDKIAEIIGGLSHAGLIAGRAHTVARLQQQAWAQTWAGQAHRWLHWCAIFRDADRGLDAWYRRGRWLFARPLQYGLMALAVVGTWIFVTTAPALRDLLTAPVPLGGGVATFLGILGGVIVLHELGHAFAVKACGFRVLGVGFGWYWFSPIFFVDTSDVWRGTRQQRMLVSLAGPYVNWITGALCALIAWGMAGAGTAHCWWLAALVSIVSALINLHPLLDYDGYYILSDYFDRPNLRSQALAYAARMWRRLWHKDQAPSRAPQQATPEIAYLGSSLLFTGLLLGIFLWLAR